MNEIVRLDHWLFALINQTWTNSLFDWFFPMITDLHEQPLFLVALVLVAGLWIWRKRMHALKWLLVLVLSVGFSDLLSFRVIKPLVDRDRPIQSGVVFTLRTSYHTGSSFPSNHAANMFAAASTLSAAEPALWPIFYLAAALVGYSRIYVGVHFPLDVFGGALIGIAVSEVVRRFLHDRLNLSSTVKKPMRQWIDSHQRFRRRRH